MESYRLKCKGVTVYRDGSRDSQVLTIGNEDKQQKVDNIRPRPRPKITYGTTQKVKIGCGNLYISVNSDENGLCEVFTNTGRQGGCASQSEATSRLLSIALRAGISKETLVEQLRGIRCPACIRREGIKVTSCPDAISKAISKVETTYNQNNAQKEITGAKEQASNDICPDCGKKVSFQEGCNICLHCGYSKCG